MHIIIAGAGIGGLGAALSCIKHGMKVTLLEQASQLREVGAGVQISSNGGVVLRELGLLEKAHEIGVKPVSFRVLDFKSNELISDMPLGPAAADRYGEPFFQFHRADLLDFIAAALPSGVLRLDSRVADFDQDRSGVTVILKSGERIRGDVLVGADGIHSVVRKKLVGDGPTAFSGKLVWRALIAADKIKELDFKDRFYGWAGKDRMVWAYWVRPKTLFNFGGVVPSTEVRRESWDDTADLDELRVSLSGANPRLKALIDTIDRAFVTGLFDRDPLPSWTAGRVTLLGDSAHPMLPYLAQGACQALEDGYVLSRCLSQFTESRVSEALADYELRRRPRTTKVQTGARAAHVFWTEGDPLQAKARNGRMAGLAQIDPLATTVWRWLYAYDPSKAAIGDVPTDKRGKRSEYAEDSPAQRKAWSMWHDLFTAADEARGVRGLREGYDRFFGQFKASPSTRVSKIIIGEASGLLLEPDGRLNDRIVLHLHGGGFAFGSAECSVEYAERLARSVGGCCLALDYRLAPEHPFPAAIEDAVEAYRHLISMGYKPDNIFFSGESAGGGLAVSAAIAVRDEGFPTPAGLLLLSPFVDCSLSSESIRKLEGKDPIIDRDILTYMATSYFQKHSPSDPRISPVYADLSKLPRMLIQAAQAEVLVDDAKRLASTAEKAGTPVTLQLYPERLHIFSLFPFLDSSKVALNEAQKFFHGNAAAEPLAQTAN
jgi:salicylate hydroxylase